MRAALLVLVLVLAGAFLAAVLRAAGGVGALGALLLVALLAAGALALVFFAGLAATGGTNWLAMLVAVFRASWAMPVARLRVASRLLCRAAPEAGAL